MPILEIHSHLSPIDTKLLDELCLSISETLDIPENLVWIKWNRIAPDEFYYKGYNHNTSEVRPIVFINCKETYSKEQIKTVMKNILVSLSTGLNCNINSIFIAVRRVKILELMVNGNLWEG